MQNPVRATYEHESYRELTLLRQLGIVEDYYEGLESLLEKGRTTRVTPEQSIWNFCTCLTNVIWYEV